MSRLLKCGWLLPAVCLVLTGCPGKQSGSAGGSKALQSVTEFTSVATEPSKAKLVLPGVDMAVDVERVKSDGEVTYILKAVDTEIEREVYEITDKVIALKEAAGEQFSPVIPILQAPMDVGDKWAWTGTTTAGDVPHQATASIETFKDTTLPIKVVVKLQIDSGGPKPAERFLTFWLQRGEGIVRREFGAGSSRVPVE